MRSRHIACLALLLAAAPASAQSLPDPTRTPGAINPDVTEATLATTICRRGWTQTVRPSAELTAALKRHQLREWGYTDRRSRDYEEDHLISLSLGGSPDDPQNLWPEPRHPADGWDAGLKDELERVLNFQVCTSRLPLIEAQRLIATDWIEAYRRFLQ